MHKDFRSCVYMKEHTMRVGLLLVGDWPTKINPNNGSIMYTLDDDVLDEHANRGRFFGVGQP